jgi:hypothetical protein
MAVITAKAGIQKHRSSQKMLVLDLIGEWITAIAGMTST